MSVTFTPTTDVSTFRFWCQKVLPAVYDDSLSYYELLCKAFEKLNEVIASNNNTSEAVTELQEAVTDLQTAFEKFKESGFEDYYAKQVAQWISDNLQYIYDTTIRQVYFGLTDDGYFCAYVPNSWKDITFDTGTVYGRSDYGRLILRFDADGEGVIDNTYSYTVSESETAKIQADLEIVMSELFTYLDEVIER